MGLMWENEWPDGRTCGYLCNALMRVSRTVRVTILPVGKMMVSANNENYCRLHSAEIVKLGPRKGRRWPYVYHYDCGSEATGTECESRTILSAPSRFPAAHFFWSFALFLSDL